MSEVEIAPAPPGCCQWIEVVKGKRSRVVRMYRCGEPAAGDTDYCREHLAAKETMGQFLRQQCKAPGTEAPGRPPDREAGDSLTFGHNWPPGYDLGGDHD
jgi:hypothetical protein